MEMSVERGKCATCIYWERDGVDGICYGGEAPQAKLAQAKHENNRAMEYTLIWPRTNPDNGCRFHRESVEVVQ